MIKSRILREQQEAHSDQSSGCLSKTPVRRIFHFAFEKGRPCMLQTKSVCPKLCSRKRENMKKRIWKRIRKAGITAFAAAVMLGNSALYQGSAKDQTGQNIIWNAEEETAENHETEEEGCLFEAAPGAGSSGIETVPLEENREEDISRENEQEEKDIFTDGGESREEDKGQENLQEKNPGEGDFEEEMLPENGPDTEKEAGFILQVRPEMEKVKAGSELLYTVTVENTGEVPVENIRFQESVGDWELRGKWETENGELLSEKAGICLEPAQKKSFYLIFSLPEDRNKPVELHLTASALYDSPEGWKELTKETDITTEVIPLKADFQVTKTADRNVAAAGDQILFQICIQNTGERTLHSVLTTEKFQMEGMTARFLEKEGVILNNDRTRALISSISPGRSFSLRAEVTVPREAKDSELINQVEVTTAETGKRVVSAGKKIKLYGKQTEIKREASGAEAVETAAEPISSIPKTGDRSQGPAWTGICLCSLAAAGLLLRKTRH